MIGRLVLAVVVSLLLLCAAIAVMVVAYLWLVSHVSLHPMRPEQPLEDNGKPPKQEGLSEADLRRLPTIECHEEEGEAHPSGCGNADCAVCLEPFHGGQRWRVIPVCSHTFHVHCADAWLSRRSVCPICRRSVAYETEEKNDGAAVALQEEEAQGEESGRSRPPLMSESVMVDMSIV